MDLPRPAPERPPVERKPRKDLSPAEWETAKKLWKNAPLHEVPTDEIASRLGVSKWTIMAKARRARWGPRIGSKAELSKWVKEFEKTGQKEMAIKMEQWNKGQDLIRQVVSAAINQFLTQVQIGEKGIQDFRELILAQDALDRACGKDSKPSQKIETKSQNLNCDLDLRLLTPAPASRDDDYDDEIEVEAEDVEEE